jgi:membrane-bound ClpP family serine protease
MPLDTPCRTVGWVLALAVMACAVNRSAAAEDAIPIGLIVPIRDASIWEEANRLEAAISKPLKRFETRRGAERRNDVFTLVLAFNSDNQPAHSDNYAACLKLEGVLRKLQNERGVLTVAWVRGSVSRHSVLPVLACQEIVMSNDARLGPILLENERLDPAQRAQYEQVIKGRFALPFAVQKMYDPSFAVVKVNQGGLPPDKRYRVKPAGVLPKLDEEVFRGLDERDLASYTFDTAKEFGLCQPQPINSLADLRLKYQTPGTTLVEAPTRAGENIVCRVVLNGTVSGGLKEMLQRRLDRARELNADVVILQLECGDGDLSKAAEMGQLILDAGRADKGKPFETIAYVSPQSRNTATFLALACDHIVMHSEARLGDFERFLEGRDKKFEEEVRDKLAEIAVRQGVPATLARALATKDAHLHWVHSTKGESDRTFVDHDTFVADRNTRWKSLEELQPGRGSSYLSIKAEDAVRFGIADKVADDWKGACDVAGVASADEVRYIRADFLDEVAEFLRHPATRGVLILLAVLGLMLELKMPGTAFPGILAAVCFVLFFWSHSQFNDETTILAILLFVLGLVLIALEIFVIPGFGVTGISGILLVITSLGLMAYGHWPRSSGDWAGLGGTLGPIGLLLIGGVILAFLVARYLPNIPGANRLMLRPPNETEDGLPSEPEEPPLASLLGAVGVAESPLRPAGKMRLGEEFVDVVAEGGYIEAGTRIQVIEVEGNRVVVKSV